MTGAREAAAERSGVDRGVDAHGGALLKGGAGSALRSRSPRRPAATIGDTPHRTPMGPSPPVVHPVGDGLPLRASRSGSRPRPRPRRPPLVGRGGRAADAVRAGAGDPGAGPAVAAAAAARRRGLLARRPARPDRDRLRLRAPLRRPLRPAGAAAARRSTSSTSAAAASRCRATCWRRGRARATKSPRSTPGWSSWRERSWGCAASAGCASACSTRASCWSGATRQRRPRRARRLPWHERAVAPDDGRVRRGGATGAAPRRRLRRERDRRAAAGGRARRRGRRRWSASSRPR